VTLFRCIPASLNSFGCLDQVGTRYRVGSIVQWSRKSPINILAILHLIMPYTCVNVRSSVIGSTFGLPAPARGEK